jgi:hypothetical protein
MGRAISVVESHRFSVSTGLVTGLAADGDMLAVRCDTAGYGVRLRSFEAQFVTTTAFGTPQRVGCQLYLAHTFTTAHTGGGDITFTGGGTRSTNDATILIGKISATAVLTPDASTVLNANPIAEVSAWSGAIGSALGPVFYDFTSNEDGGIILTADQGFVVENSVAMGATGVGIWHFTFEVDKVILSV